MNTTSIHRFVELASMGKSPSASRGERVCHQIAAVLHRLNDDLMLLDTDALEGATGLMQAAVGPFSTTAEKQAVYQMIERAGGRRRRTNA